MFRAPHTQYCTRAHTRTHARTRTHTHRTVVGPCNATRTPVNAHTCTAVIVTFQSTAKSTPSLRPLCSAGGLAGVCHQYRGPLYTRNTTIPTPRALRYTPMVAGFVNNTRPGHNPNGREAPICCQSLAIRVLIQPLDLHYILIT